MAEKQTAGRDNLGNFAPKFAELNDDVYLAKFGHVNIKYRLMIVA